VLFKGSDAPKTGSTTQSKFRATGRLRKKGIKNRRKKKEKSRKNKIAHALLPFSGIISRAFGGKHRRIGLEFEGFLYQGQERDKKKRKSNQLGVGLKSYSPSL
jgi:hypothetical protein